MEKASARHGKDRNCFKSNDGLTEMVIYKNNNKNRSFTRRLLYYSYVI